MDRLIEIIKNIVYGLVVIAILYGITVFVLYLIAKLGIGVILIPMILLIAWTFGWAIRQISL